MKLKIEHGLPIPPRRGKNEAFTVTEALRKMAVNDSIAFPRKMYNKVAALGVYVFGRGNFAMRTIDEKTVRIWRTK
jgi:hypothetical protein